MKKNKQGFTLVEIMIVVLIIGLLAAIAIPSFTRARERARTNTCINNLRQIMSAVEQAGMEEGKSNGETPEDGWEDAIRGGEPTCPSGGAYGNFVLGGNPTCDYSADHVLPLGEDAAP